MNSYHLSLSITVLANTLTQFLSTDQISLAAAVFTQLGDTLATIAAKKGLCEAENSIYSDHRDV